jgi:hypothetical protein
MKILSNCIAGSREGTGIAPTLTRAIVPAGLCELGDFRLKRLPFEARAGAARLEDHWRRTRSRAEDIESPAANVHGHADLWKPCSVTPAAELFIYDPCDERRRDQKR